MNERFLGLLKSKFASDFDERPTHKGGLANKIIFLSFFVSIRLLFEDQSVYI